MKSIVFIFVFLLSGETLGCAQSRGGEKYNALIEVSGPDSEGVFNFSVPMNLKGYDYLPWIDLVHSKKPEHDSKYVQYSEKLKLQIKDDKFVSSFKFRPEEGYETYISVYWPPEIGGMCGVYAKSKILVSNVEA